jgi:adenosylmethionine-8-amino-7-oxononanoate aminotransferase
MLPASLRQKDRNFVWHPYTSQSVLKDEPYPIIAKTKGVFLYGVDGKRYFDGISSWWASALGHNHKELVQTLAQAAKKIDHVMLGGMSHLPAIELAARISEALKQNEKYSVFFACDGSSAVEAALKIATQYANVAGNQKKNKFASLKDGYHGDTIAGMSVGFLPQFHTPFKNMCFKTFRAETPSCFPCRWGNKDNKTCALECFASIKNIIRKNAGQLAAVIVEPMCLCAGGMLIYSERYLQSLAAECKKNNVLLIFDEIAVGMGRTGKLWAFEHAGIKPDIICVGKALAGGMLPMSAVATRPHIYHALSNTPDGGAFFHSHTFGGNPLAATLALKTFEIYQKEKIVEQSAENGLYLKCLLEPFASLNCIEASRSLGMIGAIELKKNFFKYDHESIAFAQKLRKNLQKKGLLIRPLGRILYLMPPLITPKPFLKKTVELVYKELKDLCKNCIR